ncbi:MAG: hypothetical protein AAGF12_30275 [Myxococcota bacterium]
MWAERALVVIGATFVCACGTNEQPAAEPAGREERRAPPSRSVATETPPEPAPSEPAAAVAEPPTARPEAVDSVPSPRPDLAAPEAVARCAADDVDTARLALPACRQAIRAGETDRSLKGPAHAAFARVLSTLGHIEQARYHYRFALRERDSAESTDAALQETLDALPRPPRTTRSLRRRVLPRAVFEHFGGGSTWGRSIRPGTLDREIYAPLTDEGRNLRAALIAREGGTTRSLWVEAPAGTVRLTEVDGMRPAYSGGGFVTFRLRSARFERFLPESLPQIVVELDSEKQRHHECSFRQRDERLLLLFAIDDEHAYLYASIVLSRTESHEVSMYCEPRPEGQPTREPGGPTFHWELSYTLDPDAGELRLEPVAGRFPEAVTTPILLRDHHCHWARQETNWSCTPEQRVSGPNNNL